MKTQTDSNIAKVLKHNGRWKIVPPGYDRPMGSYATKQAATKVANWNGWETTDEQGGN